MTSRYYTFFLSYNLLIVDNGALFTNVYQCLFPSPPGNTMTIDDRYAGIKFQNCVFGNEVFNFSGLDVSKDQILEIACVITDKELDVLAEVCVSHHK